MLMWLSSIRLAFLPKIRLFIILPLIINLLSLSFAIWWVIDIYDGLSLNSWFDAWPAWLDWLSGIINAMIFGAFYLLLIPLAIFSFGILGAVISAPFNGLLSEQTTEHIVLKKTDSRFTLNELWPLFTRSIAREFTKLAYFLPRAFVLVILSFIPLINFIVPLLWVIFGSWMAALQYLDYAADNEGFSFDESRKRLAQNLPVSLGFGFWVWIIMFVPVLNFVLIPVTVIAATRLWFKHFDYESDDDII